MLGYHHSKSLQIADGTPKRCISLSSWRLEFQAQGLVGLFPSQTVQWLKDSHVLPVPFQHVGLYANIQIFFSYKPVRPMELRFPI